MLVLVLAEWSKMPDTYPHLPSTYPAVLQPEFSHPFATLGFVRSDPEVDGVTCGFMAQQLLDMKFLPSQQQKSNLHPPVVPS